MNIKSRNLLKEASGMLVATALVAGIYSNNAWAQEETVTWRVQSHWPGASSSYEDSLVAFRDALDERTDGRLQLQLHEAGALFGHDEIFGAVERGIIQMGTISPAYIMDRVSLAGIAFGLPGAFQEPWEAAYYFKNMGFEDMMREEVGGYGVFYFTEKVYPTEMVVSQPIESLQDFEGLNIRSSGTLQTFLTQSGAAASMIPGEELYTALATGVVDGAHWGAAQGAMSMGLYEVAPYHVHPPLNVGGIDAFIFNQEAIDELPDDLREIFLTTLEEHFWRRTNEYQYQEQVTLAQAQEEMDVQVIELPEEVQAQMATAAERLWEQEGQKSEQAGQALAMLRELRANLGYDD